MEASGQVLLSALGVWIPRIIGALLILLLGWIIVKLLAVITQKVLHWVKLDARSGKGWKGPARNP